MTLLFAVFAMTGMLCFAGSREYVYAEESKLPPSDILQNVSFQGMEKKLNIGSNSMEAAHFCIPLNSVVKEENVVIQSNDLEHRLQITISGLEEDFYERNELLASGDYVISASYQYEQGVMRLSLQTKQLYDHNAVIKNGNLYLNFTNPRDIYQKILVIDAGHGGSDAGIFSHGVAEKDLTLSIVKRIKEKLDKTDIKVYYTRLEDITVAELRRAEIANELDADMLVSIHMGQSDQEETFGAAVQYNPRYFIPDFGNIELADGVEKNVVRQAGTAALGLKEAGEDVALIQSARVPAALLEAGMLSNEKERILLSDEQYQERIATGVYHAILEAYEKLE